MIKKMAMDRKNKNRKRYLLVCFDLDGTIVDKITSIWKFIGCEFGVDPVRREKGTREFFDNIISYDEWVGNDVRLWMEKGITKDRFIRAVRKLKLMRGAREALDKLRAEGVKLAVISDGLDIVLEALMPDYRNVFDDVFINRLKFDSRGRLEGWQATEYCMDRKADGLKAIAKREGISLSKCAFVGDESNDIGAVRLAGLGIAFNSSSEELNRACDIVVRKKDLREILKYL